MTEKKDNKGEVIDLASKRPSPQFAAMREILKGIGETAQLIEEVRAVNTPHSKIDDNQVVTLFPEKQRDEEIERRVRNGEIPPESFITDPDFLKDHPNRQELFITALAEERKKFEKQFESGGALSHLFDPERTLRLLNPKDE